jgi:hypothetical protein
MRPCRKLDHDDGAGGPPAPDEVVTSLAQLRKTTLSLPATAEQPIRFGMVALLVRDKRFAFSARPSAQLDARSSSSSGARGRDWLWWAVAFGGAGWDAGDAFERSREGGLGVVAEPAGELGHGGALGLQRVLGELHAPAGQVPHGGLVDQLAEAGGECRA